MEIANPVLAHQACGFLGDAQTIALLTIMCMDAVVFASGHGAFLIDRWHCHRIDHWLALAKPTVQADFVDDPGRPAASGAQKMS
ncbi:MAG TPA: hypothetical protein VMV99_15515 [Rhodanobacter sp.]|nr:hypothetical protein [Rhodanobacter sp.]